jgi:hypothetical protein
VIGQIVTGAPPGSAGPDWSAGPDGKEIGYRISFGGPHTTPRVIPGSVEGADIVIVTGYDDALALAAGDVSAVSLLAGGRVKLRGDASRLVEAASLLEAVAVAAAPDLSLDLNPDDEEAPPEAD